jgi:hypothetical protein
MSLARALERRMSSWTRFALTCQEWTSLAVSSFIVWISAYTRVRSVADLASAGAYLKLGLGLGEGFNRRGQHLRANIER